MENYRSELPFRRRIGGNSSVDNRIKTTIIGGSPPRSRALSPRSVADLTESRCYEQQTPENRHTTTLSVVGAKRKFPYDASFSIVPASTPYMPSSPSSSTPRSSSVNLRHRLLCDEMVEWLAVQSNNEGHPPVSELWLGPVFESPETVLSAIATLPTTVTHLDLDLRNALHLVSRAMPLLLSKQHLQSLSVRVFGDAGAIDLAKELHRNNQLKQLDIRGNRIGSLGCRTLVDAMIACGHTLATLNLSCNCILNGDMIGQLLAWTQHLQSLDLAFNWLGDKEVQDICKGLCKNNSLRELDLYGCQRISNAGLRTILECVEHHNTSLHEIRLQAFSEEGEKVLREIDHWLALNKAGRYLIQSAAPVPESLWPSVLAKSNRDPNSLFYLLREAIGPAKAGKRKGR
jgi:Leucine Rich repeat